MARIRVRVKFRLRLSVSIVAPLEEYATKQCLRPVLYHPHQTKLSPM